MLRDIFPFLKDVFKSWWIVVGVINGLISFLGRIYDLERFVPYISRGFAWLACVCLAGAIVSVYHRQKEQIRALQRSSDDRAAMGAIHRQKLWGEVSYAIAHLNEPAMLHDDAFAAMAPDDMRYLPAPLIHDISEFYRDLRSLKNIAEGADQRSSVMRRRKELQEKLALDGAKICGFLKQNPSA